MNDLYPVLWLIIVVGWVFGFQIVSGKLDRRRIREHVESHGGKVLNIERSSLSSWPSRSSDRTYDVRYKTQRGEIITASCRTSLTNDVYWVSDRPPGSLGDLT